MSGNDGHTTFTMDLSGNLRYPDPPFGGDYERWRAYCADWEQYRRDLAAWKARENLRLTTMRILPYESPPRPPVEPNAASSPRWMFRA